MSIFLNKDSKVIVQGITGGEGTKHTALMLKAGTQHRRRRQRPQGRHHRRAQGRRRRDVELPVFGTVAEAMEKTGADVSIVFVPPAFTKDADHRGHRRRDPAAGRHHRGHPGAGHRRCVGLQPVDKGNKTRIIGPNCPGIITPGEALVGITPANITGKGPIGLVSKSGTLTYQMMYELRDLGFSTAIGIGGDPVIGTTHIDALEAFEEDPETKAIVMIGEIGGDAEERAADYIKANVPSRSSATSRASPRPRARRWATPAPSCPARPAPPQAKKEALEAAGVKVGKTPSETAALAREILQSL